MSRRPGRRGRKKKINYRKLAFKILPHKCDECGWKDYPEILEVHHINGIHNDNREDNLQLLCPTCHRIHHYIDKKIETESFYYEIDNYEIDNYEIDNYEIDEIE